MFSLLKGLVILGVGLVICGILGCRKPEPEIPIEPLKPNPPSIPSCPSFDIQVALLECRPLNYRPSSLYPVNLNIIDEYEEVWEDPRSPWYDSDYYDEDDE